MIEVRARDLAFSPDEASVFFAGQLSAPLPDADVRMLVERTEGWVAGLQLAALRLRERDDPAAFIARFTGVDRHVVDYLSEEVLSSLPEATPAEGPDALTDRELDILRLLPGSLSQRELADLPFVTPNTLKAHLRAIYRKLGVGSRGEAVLHARRTGMI